MENQPIQIRYAYENNTHEALLLPVDNVNGIYEVRPVNSEAVIRIYINDHAQWEINGAASPLAEAIGEGIEAACK